MTADIVVRQARPSDAAALVELAKAVGSEPEGWLISTDDWRGTQEERRLLRALREHPDACVFVAQAPEGIVGRLSIARDPHPASAHVADLGLMVASSHRRRGIGRLLLARAEEWARAAGILKLELHVFPHNAAALALYEAVGFRREGHRKVHYRRADGYADAVLMALLLPPSRSE